MLKLFVRLLLIATMAFHTMHAYYIDHSHESVAHYVQETQSSITKEHSSCAIHHFFHIPFIVESFSFSNEQHLEKSIEMRPFTFFFFDLTFSLLKPPRV